MLEKTKSCYTLVELLAAMAVFSLLMLALMQFIASTQKIWMNCEQKNTMYENARVALDLMSRDIQCAYYEWDRVPFLNEATGSFSPTTTNKKRICFVTSSSNKPSIASVPSVSRFVETQYYWDDSASGASSPNTLGDDKLKIKRVGDVSGTTIWNFYQDSGNVMNSAVTTAVYGASLSDTQISTITADEIIPYVVDFSVTAFDYKGNTVSDPRLFPYGVKIDISLLDKDSYNKWVASGKSSSSELKTKNVRKFSRTVIIGNRGQYRGQYGTTL